MPGRGRPRTPNKAENTHEILVRVPGGSKLSTPQRAASLVPTGGLTSPNLRPFFLSALIYLKCGPQKPSRYREGRGSSSLGLGEGSGAWLRPCLLPLCLPPPFSSVTFARRSCTLSPLGVRSVCLRRELVFSGSLGGEKSCWKASVCLAEAPACV